MCITGRKKDLIITSSGKNVSPEMLESALRETRWISQAIAAGDRRSYLVALVTLDPDEAPKLAEQAGVPPDLEAMADDEKVREIVWKDIDAVNQKFARIEQIKRFAILPRDLSQEEGELTPTLKVKRAVVYERFGPRSRRSTRAPLRSDDRRAGEAAGAKVLERLAASLERVRRHARGDGDLRRQPQELLAVRAGEVGDASAALRSCHSSSYGNAGMSLMWMPAQTTVPPGASARSAAGTSAPTGAKMIAASSGSGGARPAAGPLRAELAREVVRRRRA